MNHGKYNYKPVVLVVLDGFGVDATAVYSPWHISQHPVFSEIERFWPLAGFKHSGWLALGRGGEQRSRAPDNG